MSARRIAPQGPPAAMWGPHNSRFTTERDVSSANAVVYALVVALLDLEQRRTGGKVRPPMRRRALA